MFLCCYVVKLSIAKKDQKGKTQKSGSTSGYFYKTSYGCMCQSYCFFWGCFVAFFLAAQKHYKNRFFDDFDMMIFSFLVKISRSITWPPQGQ